MTSRQDSGSAKRLKNESFEVEDFTLNYDSPLEDFKEESHVGLRTEKKNPSVQSSVQS